MQIFALSTGSWWMGGLSMMLFSLGTIPLMATVGGLSQYLTAKFNQKMTFVSACLVILLSLFMFSNSLAFLGGAI
jgi:sulfite exporter TauE/SafE